MIRTAPHRPPGRRAVVVAALTAAAALPAAAQGQEVQFTFEGRGFGHGVGMSQYGARGAALQGWDAARILGWYYRGATLVTRPGEGVRVLLVEGVGSVQVGGTGPAELVDRGDGRRVPLVPGTSYTVSAGGPGVVVSAPSGGVVMGAAAGVRVEPAAGLVRASGRRYRGVVDVVPSGGALRVVNTLPSELYVQGVLPGEMPASWGDDTPAALQAQAVAARTYALANRDPGRSFDVYDDTRSQVYVGIDGEDRRANAAVAATRNRVLVHEGRLITAYYSSTSGGHTENVENSLGGNPAPFLVGVPDPFDDVSPVHRWPRPPTFTASALGARLRVGGPVAEFAVVRRGVSPRVILARVTTADGRVTDLSGSTVKARLGLMDTWFWVRRSDRPAPAEPPYPRADGAPAPAAPVAAPRAPASDVVRKGRYMAVATRQYRRGSALAVRRRIAGLRPRAVVVTRTVGSRRIHLVVTGRYRTSAAALRERAVLRRRGFRAAAVVPARDGEPAVRPVAVAVRRPTAPRQTPRRSPSPAVAVPPAPRPPTATAPAGARFRVVAAEVENTQQATAVVTRLGGTGRRPTVVSRWSSRTGTRYLVLTLTGATSQRAEAESEALRALGLTPRVEREPG